MGYWQANPATINTNASNGWPLFDARMATAMIAQFYDQQENTTGTNFAQTGGEQPISTLPSWTSLYVTIDNVTFLPYVDPTNVTEYSQNMSIRNGIVTTSMVWNGVRLNYTVLAHRTIPTLGIVRLEIEPVDGSVLVTITDMLDGAGSWRTNFNDSSANSTTYQLVSSVQPDGISDVNRSKCVKY
jgi:trehalose/maltose hydrolase-like predicted phosphorylase